MEYEKAQGLGIPKRAFTKPSLVSTAFLVFVVIAWVPHTLTFFINTFGVQSWLAIFLAPLAIVGLFCAYYSGLTLAKYNYGEIEEGNLVLPYIVLVTIHISCITCCIVCETLWAGYPFTICFNLCEKAEMPTAVFAYSIVTTALFLPAYYAIYRYYQWVVKYKTSVLSQHQNN